MVALRASATVKNMNMDISRPMPSHATELLRSRRILIGVAALVVGLLGAATDVRAFCAAWLVAWWTCASVVLGAQANLWMHDITGGGWGRSLRPVWIECVRRMPRLLLLMLPLLIAVWTLYPWSEPGWHPQAEQAGFKALWLTPWLVALRLLVYGAVWMGLMVWPTRNAAPRKGHSAVGLLGYAISVSLAGFDLIMALMPEWYSSGFGLLLIAMQMKLAFAFAVWRGTSPSGIPRQLGRDLGNLLLMYVLMWAYLGFVQFLIIWAENLPHEIAWYVPRLQTNWAWLALLLLVCGFFLPLLLLLFRAVKESARFLTVLAAGLCLMGYAEVLWVILPSVDRPGWHVAWMTPLMTTGMVLLMWPKGRRHG